MVNGSLALCGAAGGVGTTRLTVACGTMLARHGYDVAVLDAAYATQGLSDYVSGRLDPDMSALCLGDDPLETGLVDFDIDGGGRLAACPVRAPFERLARAQTPEAAQALERRMAEAARGFEFVLVDTPPVASNQAVAAVTAAAHVALVCDEPRAVDAIPRGIDRLEDIGVDEVTRVVTGVESHPDADVAVPRVGTDLSKLDTDTHDALATLLAAVFDVTVSTDADSTLRDRLPL